MKEEIAAGMEAGACFGLSATVCKIGFILAESGMSRWFVPAGIAVGVCCSGSGFFCQTRGLKDGRAVVVSTCAAVASIVIGVLMGLFALGESLPGSSFGRYLLLLAWYIPAKKVHPPILLFVVTLVPSAVPNSLHSQLGRHSSTSINFLLHFQVQSSPANGHSVIVICHTCQALWMSYSVLGVLNAVLHVF